MANWTIFGPLTACFIAASSIAAQAQEAQPGSAESEEVVLVADEVYELRDTKTIIAEGNVEAEYQGRILRANRVEYNRETQKVRATGDVVIIDTDGTQRFADEIEVDSNLSDGYAIGFSARLPEGATAAANAAIRQEGGLNAFDQIVYTACEICNENDTPTWSIRARRAVLDEEAQMYSYRDAVIEVGGVPVFYLPYLAHPDPSAGRRSGLLTPNPGLSSKLGAFYRQPYYWAISPYSDLTVTPHLNQRVNPLLEFDYRKRFWSGQVEVNTSVTNDFIFDGDGVRSNDPDFSLGDDPVFVDCTEPPNIPGQRRVDCSESWRSHIYAQGLFNITPKWSWGFGAERMSDDLYTRRYNIDGENERRGLYNTQPRRLLSQLFLIGQDTDFYADATVFSIQGLRENDDDARLPTAAPVAFAERLFDLGDYGHAAISGSTAFLNRDIGQDSRRASLAADWSQTTVLPGGFLLEPFSEARVDYYSLDENENPGGVANVTRGLGNVGFQVSYPLIRPGENFDIMITPIAMGAWGLSNVNDRDIPNEDTLLYEFDEATLFEANAFSNYDLYEGDGKAALGFTTQMRWKGGTTITTIAGRRWRSRSDPQLTKVTNLDGTASDWLAGVTTNFGRRLRASARVRLDDDSLALNRIDARLSTQIWRARLSTSYYKVDEDISALGRPDEGISIQGEFQVTDRYSVVYQRLRNIEDGFDARHVFGVAYEDECARFEIAYEQTEFQDRTIGPSESIQFRFSLKSLGEFGSNEFD